MATKTKTTNRIEGNGSLASTITIAPPDLPVVEFVIRGTAPLVQNRFPAKAMQMMRETQEAGSTAKKGKKKEAKNFTECYEQSMHLASKADGGWNGHPCASFRNACVSACRICGFQMTKAKLSIFCLPNGFEADGTPLVKITKGKPRQHEAPVRLASGVCDIHARAMFDPGWEMIVSVQFDADQFTVNDVTNLMCRVGMQVGIGEGRHDSKASNGMGWGLFELLGKTA